MSYVSIDVWLLRDLTFDIHSERAPNTTHMTSMTANQLPSVHAVVVYLEPIQGIMTNRMCAESKSRTKSASRRRKHYSFVCELSKSTCENIPAILHIHCSHCCSCSTKISVACLNILHSASCLRVNCSSKILALRANTRYPSRVILSQLLPLKM